MIVDLGAGMRNGVSISTAGPVTAEDPELVAAESRAADADCAPHCSVPLTTDRLSYDEAAQLSAVFKAMSHPTRVQLMNLLVGSRFAVCAYDLQVAMGIPQSTMSHHLKQLVSSGLVHRQQRGIWAYYSINVEAMRALSLVINLDDAPQPLSPAALRDPAIDPVHDGETGGSVPGGDTLDERR